MTFKTLKIVCESESDTRQLAETLAIALRRGDLVTLSGDLGAGKTTLARALIRSASRDNQAEVPSPTFTLVQVYESLPFGTLAHLDLYRIQDPHELEELGLHDALSTGVALVEWPEKGEGELPEPTLSLTITAEDDDARTIEFHGTNEAMTRVQRSLAMRDFLNRNGHAQSRRYHLTGDASTRSYETIVSVGGADVIAMNAPTQPDGPALAVGKPYSQIARLAEDMHAFVGVAKALTAQGFRAPEVHAHDLEQGFLLIENLGDEGIITPDRAPIRDRYLASMETLAALHAKTWNAECAIEGETSHTIPPFDRAAMMIEVDLLVQWYAPYKLGRGLNDDEIASFHSVWDDLVTRLDGAEKSLLLRDYHSPNIIWVEGATGTDRTGIIDFQDALIGPTAYDVASIAQDARIAIPAELEAELLEHYCRFRRPFDETGFREAYAIMAAQRVTKVLGIFVRLFKRDGKDAYLAHLPHMEAYLERSLTHPALADYRAWVENTLNG